MIGVCSRWSANNTFIDCLIGLDSSFTYSKWFHLFHVFKKIWKLYIWGRKIKYTYVQTFLYRPLLTSLIIILFILRKSVGTYLLQVVNFAERWICPHFKIIPNFERLIIEQYRFFIINWKMKNSIVYKKKTMKSRNIWKYINVVGEIKKQSWETKEKYFE